MPLHTLLQKLTDVGFFPIRIEGSTDKSDSNGLVFLGDLDEFIKTAKFLKAEFIFVVNTTLSKSDFEYETNGEDVGQGDEDENINPLEPFYLPSIVPKLKGFEKHIGADCKYRLFIPTPNRILEIYIEEPWWKEFVTLIVEAVSKVEQDIESARATKRAELEARRADALSKLRKLTTDNDFIRLPTQKAMLVYAIDKIPELETIEQSILQTEIQNLYAKLTAKGLVRKR